VVSPQALHLTPQQTAVVAHNRGPVVVYAVAGAGKTTALVLRVVRLVEEGVFPPQAILATSFNREANREIRAALDHWPACAAVHVQTLHALGYRILRQAARHGRLAALEDAGDLEGSDRRLLKTTLAALRPLKLDWIHELDGLDWDDFLAYVGGCKGNLAYPEAVYKTLPRSLRRWAKPAPRPDATPWYADLYAAYEAQRLAAGQVTFDDLVTTAWEALMTDPRLLAAAQARYACVLVDEYQDVTPAQAALVDLLVAAHRNLMVIGDDDQTIYGWRGASQDHLLNFRRRNRATSYTLAENFRCPAGPVALANQVIRHNRTRQPKQIVLTQGFAGTAQLHRCRDEEGQAEAIAAALVEAAGQGWKANQMAVLVRVYAQTPPIVAALQRAGLHTRVTGEGPAQAGSAVTLTSIHRAKGLEWPVVCVPHCNLGFLPLTSSGQENPARLEEERRLLYVAITRARHALHLYALADLPLSPFLDEAQAGDVLAAVQEMQAALARDPAQWQTADYTALGVNAMQLGFHDYFATWWDAPLAQRSQIAGAILGFYTAARAKGAQRGLGIGKRERAVWQQAAGRAGAAPMPPMPAELSEFLARYGTR
jgi:superfamily I DNA/RNA helicase